MDSITLDNHVYSIYNVDIHDEVNPSTNNNLKQLVFDVDVIGEEDKKTLQEILEAERVSVLLPETEQAIDFRVGNNSRTHNLSNGSPIEYKFKIHLHEVDKDEPEPWNMQVGTSVLISINYTRILSIVNLLIAKGIITEEELNAMYSEIGENCRQNVIEFITSGKGGGTL